MTHIETRSSLRIVRLGLWGLVAIVIAGLAAFMLWPRQPAKPAVQADYASAFGGPFRPVSYTHLDVYKRQTRQPLIVEAAARQSSTRSFDRATSRQHSR